MCTQNWFSCSKLKIFCDFFSKLVIANQNSNSTSDKYDSGLGV